MFLPVAMTLSVIISIILGFLLVKHSEKEEDPMFQFFSGCYGILFFFFAGAGALGIIAKTFELWGNSW